jgi:hypothetical protein
MKTNQRLIEALESRIAPAFSGSISLAILTGSDGGKPGFRIDGVLDGDQSGFSVADAGDVNGDGFSDLIVGAPNVEVNGTQVGAAYVIFGNDTGFTPTLDLDSLDGTNGFRIEGTFANGRFGQSVSGAGDFNGDGFDDLVISAPLTNNGAGATYVLFGKSSSFGEKFDLATINGTNGFIFVGNQVGEFTGSSVSKAGDINGDGYGDIVIGAVGHDTVVGGNVVADAGGAAYVLYGHNGTSFTFTNAVTLGTAGQPGFRLDGVNDNDNSGNSLSFLGDFNGDGFDDFLVGASASDSQGKANIGRTYVVYGKAADFPTSMSLGNVAGPLGAQIVGINDGDGLGISVHGAGDINGDGLADIILGATSSDVNGSSSGEAYIIYGRTGVISGTINATNSDLRIQGADGNDFLGSSVSGIGDFNGDGFDDVLVGVPGTISEPGASYVVFGRPDGFAGPINVSTLDGTAGFKLPGLNVGDGAGEAVSGAGDVNGDGYSDLIIGAPSADHGPTDAGESYVLFGFNGDNFVTVGADGKTATYTDADGDLVTIRVSKGTLDANDFVLSGANYLGGATLQKIDFNGRADLEGANVKITAKPQLIGGALRGDGLANVGTFDGDSVNFSSVKIGGDLGHIFASSAKSLTVNSLGSAGLSTQKGMDANLNSVIGSVKTLVVKTDVSGVNFASAQLGKVSIGGDLDNSLFALSGGPVTGQKPATALKSLTVGGDLDHTQILVGASVFGGNADVAIGKVLVKGDWIASNLSAGVTAGNDGKLGTDDDQLYAGGNASILSRIASVMIKGQALGTIEPGGAFAITAEQVGKVTIGKTKLSLDPAGKDKLLALGATGDFILNEV